MSRINKRKVNLTIDPNILEAAYSVAEQRGRSLSALVEEFLARLASELPETKGDWLTAFHDRFLDKSKRDPSDREIVKMRDELMKTRL